MSSVPSVRYRIFPLDPHAHLFEVRCTVADPDPAGQRFRLPVWIPGSYLIREFARHFVSVRAETDGRVLAVAKEAKDVWVAAPSTQAVTMVAQVYAYDLSVRTAYLDATRGYFNGTAVFVCPEGRADRRCEVEIIAPGDGVGRSWRVATTLPPGETSVAGFGSYHAANYDELIDHPVEMSDFALATFEAGGATHDIAVSGRQRADLARLTRDLARICQWHCDLFGGAAGSRAPFPRYLFQVTAVGDGYGGLEHRTSTSLLCKRNELPQPGVAGITDDYRRFLGLASHEYFHAWQVKRIKPAAFTPYDLARENYTRQLWAFEGITSYYDDLALARSGVIDARSFLELLGRTITTVLRNPGRHVQSIAESSFDAWIKYYRQDENTPNAVVSYYAKGALVALALDLTLRQHGSSLDALMQALWRRFGQTGIGVPEDGVPRIAAELAGRDIDAFFARHVEGTEDPPLATLLASVGVTLNLRAADNAGDRGGGPGRRQGNDGPDSGVLPSLGAAFAAGSDVKLQQVRTGGAAERAGLAAGDVLIAVDGLRVSANSLESTLETRRAGETLMIHAFRRDELFTTALTLDAAPLDTCWLTPDNDVAVETQGRRSAWLGPDWNFPSGSGHSVR